MVTLHKLIYEYMKINFSLIAFIILLAWSVGATYLGYQFYQEFSRVSGNQELLLQQVHGLQKEKQLVLTPKEFKHSLDSSTEAMMDRLDLKVKHIENAIKVSVVGQSSVTVGLRDTTIIQNNTIVNASSFVHKEKYLNMTGFVFKNSAFIDWSTSDSLNILLYWHREGKFIPKIFGKKVYQGAIEGQNPYIKYSINQNIKVQKR